MEKEVEAAGEVAKPEVSGGFDSYKETVFDILEKFFSWLSTHQIIGLILILLVLGIIIWLIARTKKYRKQLESESYLKKKELDKKDTKIGELDKKLTHLQNKLSDQQGVVREALLSTIKTLTGYDADQLPAFFKSLTRLGENPLQIADIQTNPAAESQPSEETVSVAAEERNSAGEDVAEEQVAPGDDTSKEFESDAQAPPTDGASAENDTKEQNSSGLELEGETDLKEKSAPGDDSSEEDAVKNEIASKDDAPGEDGKQDKTASADSPEEEANTKKIEEEKQPY